MARTALEEIDEPFEDDWTTAWGGVGGVASGGGGVSGNGRYIECNIAKMFQEMMTVEERVGDKGSLCVYRVCGLLCQVPLSV